MIFIILSVLAILAAVFSGQHWGKKIQIRFIIVVIVIGMVLLIGPYAKAIFEKIRLVLDNVKFESSPNSVSQRPIWIDIIMFIAMILGMITHQFYVLASSKSEFRLDWGKLLGPLVASPIIFIPLYYLVVNIDGSSIILLVLFSFQNGFFWGNILERQQSSKA